MAAASGGRFKGDNPTKGRGDSETARHVTAHGQRYGPGRHQDGVASTAATGHALDIVRIHGSTPDEIFTARQHHELWNIARGDNECTSVSEQLYHETIVVTALVQATGQASRRITALDRVTFLDGYGDAVQQWPIFLLGGARRAQFFWQFLLGPYPRLIVQLFRDTIVRLTRSTALPSRPDHPFGRCGRVASTFLLDNNKCGPQFPGRPPVGCVVVVVVVVLHHVGLDYYC